MAVARADAIRTLAFGGISGTYAPIGTVLTVNWRVFCVTNNTNGDVFISFDGTTNNLFIPAGGFRLYDITSNAANVANTDGLVLAINTQIYVKQSTAPSSGAVWIEGFYARGI